MAPTAFANWLEYHQLGPLWLAAGLPWPDNSAANANKARQFAMAALLRDVVMHESAAALDAAGIEYTFFKGAHTARWLWHENPALRPAADVDLLINPQSVKAADAALSAASAQIIWLAETASYEFTALMRGVEVDVHWHVLRAARLRQPLSGELLRRRIRVGKIWTLCPSDAAFIMLVHPAFTKYVCSPYVKLIRVLDFARAARSGEVDWQHVVALCERNGVKAAAWTTLTWMRSILPTLAVPESVDHRLAPGRTRQRYLSLWLDLNLPTRLIQVPQLTAAAFTLPMHDTWNDAARAMAAIVRTRRLPVQSH